MSVARSWRIARWSVLGTIVTLFVLWWAYVRAPTPTEVCDHIVEVTTREAKQSGLSEEAEGAMVLKLRERCVQHKLDKIQLRGRLQYADYAKCVLDKGTLIEIERCGSQPEDR
jgi:hypothetical protein